MKRTVHIVFVLALVALTFVGASATAGDAISPADIQTYIALQRKLEELTARRNQLLAEQKKLREAQKDYAGEATAKAAPAATTPVATN